MFGIKGYAKGIAKAQLRSYLMYRKQYPEMKPEELYLAAIKTRPGYSEKLILGLIQDAKASAIKEGGKLNLQEVVYTLATFEYSRNKPNTDWQKRSNDWEAIKKTIHSIIPANL